MSSRLVQLDLEQHLRIPGDFPVARRRFGAPAVARGAAERVQRWPSEDPAEAHGSTCSGGRPGGPLCSAAAWT
nr:unnamed protein product [Digitaria exilis]